MPVISAWQWLWGLQYHVVLEETSDVLSDLTLPASHYKWIIFAFFLKYKNNSQACEVNATDMMLGYIGSLWFFLKEGICCGWGWKLFCNVILWRAAQTRIEAQLRLVYTAQ